MEFVLKEDGGDLAKEDGYALMLEDSQAPPQPGGSVAAGRSGGAVMR